MVGLAALLCAACTAPADHTGTAGTYTVTVRAEPNPAALGDTHLTVTVTDANGKAVPDAMVTARMFMAGMPMNTDDDLLPGTPQGKGRYVAAGEFSMGGNWQVEVSVTPDNGKSVTATFPYTIEWKLD
ncbi:MAG: FixH family protein [Nitrospirota bacterium]|nr:FixH family protein [Nitrospirota bacterium]